jgi:DNA mismatch repair protein MutS2
MHALKVLEFQAVRERLAHHCETPIAAAWAADLEPSFDRAEVWRQLKETGEAHDAIARHHVPGLVAVKDYRHALKRASKGGVLGGQELFGISEALKSMRALKSFLQQRKADYELLARWEPALPEQPRLEQTLSDSLEGDGTLKDTASVTLAGLRQRKKQTVARIQERIQSYTTGKARELLSDPIYTVREGRYVIPLKSENRGKIRGIVHDTSASGQTVFLEPEDVLQLGNSLRELEANERAEEHKILATLSGKVGAIADEATGGIETASRLDFVFAKARLGFEMKGTLPIEQGSARIAIQGGRHPLLDPQIAVPLDIEVGQGKSVLITGPNTGGKTVSIKTVGLFVLMAQSGLLVPARDVRLGAFAQVWADIGDEQSLEQSLSTFSGHIKNIAQALKFLKAGSLVLLDEVGAGTDPAEGAALAKAILTRMSEKGATILASTHYGELKAFAYNTEAFENAAMEFDSKTLRPTYRLLMGSPGASHALKIAERYGIPREVVDSARESLGQQAQELADMFERLEQSQRQARIAQSEADKRLAELRKAEEKAAKKLAEADEVRRTAASKANEVIEAALREIRLEAARLFDELKREPKSQEKVRQGLKDLQEAGSDLAREIAPRPRVVRGQPTVELKKGMTVRIDGYSQVGTLLEAPGGKKAQVQVGQIKLEVPVASLQPAEKRSEPAKARPNIRLQKAMTATSEIHLRNMRAEDAIPQLEKFIDDATLAGLPSVRIVHGKGEGILRKITQDYLRRNPDVASYREGEPAEGGAGVTIATLK